MNSLVNVFAQFWFIIPVIFSILIFKTRWFKGVWGEFLINRLLARLPANDYVTLRNITLPTDSGTTQIDHIVVSKFGIFVIETKNMKGWIFGSVQQAEWTQKIYRHTIKFQNPLRQNYKHTKTLASVLSCPAEHIHSIIIFTGRSVFKTEMPDNVIYAKGCLKYILSFQNVIMTTSEVMAIVNAIEDIRFKRSLTTHLAHKAHVKSIVAKKQLENTCPKCGSIMVIRESKRGENMGQKFWGCSQFPKCKTIINFD